MPAEAPAEHLLQHGEVIRALDCLDLEVPIVGRFGSAILEDDHRADRVLALDVGNVVALDPDREGRQRQPRLQVVEQRGRAVGIVVQLDAQLAHRFLRVGGGLLQ